MITVRCQFCGENWRVPVTLEQITDWKCGMLIQQAMPHLTKEMRELLISRTCAKCWSRLFGEEELYGLGR